MKSRSKKKRIVKILILLSAVLLLTGCAGSAKSEAPMLTVSAGKAKIRTVRTTFSWQNGTAGVEADGLHPLDMAEDLPVIEVPEDGIVSFEFETAPDKIVILAWKASAAGSENYGDPEFSLPVSEDHTVTLPSNERYLYQVHAIWELQDGIGGNAYYGFASSPASRP